MARPFPVVVTATVSTLLEHQSPHNSHGTFECTPYYEICGCDRMPNKIRAESQMVIERIQRGCDIRDGSESWQRSSEREERLGLHT